MLTKTYKQTVKAIEDFATAHKQIRGWGHGDLYNLSSKDEQYPLLWCTPVPSTLAFNNLRQNFHIAVLDIIKENDSNLIDIMSDAQQIAIDFISYFSNEVPELQLNDDNILLEPIQHQFDDNLAGVFLEISFDVFNDRDTCGLPL